jgi:Rrf2 family protein
MLSNPSKYALKAMIFLVVHSSEANKISVKDTASETNVPGPFLSKILQQLVSKGYVSSSKGRNGGFYLTPEQLTSSILNIIVAIEEKDIFKRCALNFENCDAQNPCKIHELIAPAKEALRNRFKTVSLNDLKFLQGANDLI